MAAREAEAHEREVRSLGRSVWLATLLRLPVFVLEMGAHFMPGIYEMVAATIGQEGSWYLPFALATIVQFAPGMRLFQHGVPSLQSDAPSMNPHVAPGTGSAWGYSGVANF